MSHHLWKGKSRAFPSLYHGTLPTAGLSDLAQPTTSRRGAILAQAYLQARCHSLQNSTPSCDRNETAEGKGWIHTLSHAQSVGYQSTSKIKSSFSAREPTLRSSILHFTSPKTRASFSKGRRRLATAASAMVEVEAEDDVHHSNTSRQTDLGDGVERERRGGRKWDEGINGLPGIDGGGRMSAGRGAERGNRKGKKGIGDDHEDEAGSSNRKKEFSRVGGKMFGLGNSEEEVAPGRSQKLDYSGSTHGLGAGKDYTEASFRGGHDSGNRLKDIRQIATQHMLDLDMQRLGEASGKESDSRRNDFRDGAGGEVIEAMGENVGMFRVIEDIIQGEMDRGREVELRGDEQKEPEPGWNVSSGEIQYFGDTSTSQYPERHTEPLVTLEKTAASSTGALESSGVDLVARDESYYESESEDVWIPGHRRAFVFHGPDQNAHTSTGIHPLSKNTIQTADTTKFEEIVNSTARLLGQETHIDQRRGLLFALRLFAKMSDSQRRSLRGDCLYKLIRCLWDLSGFTKEDRARSGGPMKHLLDYCLAGFQAGPEGSACQRGLQGGEECDYALGIALLSRRLDLAVSILAHGRREELIGRMDSSAWPLAMIHRHIRKETDWTFVAAMAKTLLPDPEHPHSIHLRTVISRMWALLNLGRSGAVLKTFNQFQRFWPSRRIQVLRLAAALHLGKLEEARLAWTVLLTKAHKLFDDEIAIIYVQSLSMILGNKTKSERISKAAWELAAEIRLWEYGPSRHNHATVLNALVSSGMARGYRNKVASVLKSLEYSQRDDPTSDKVTQDRIPAIDPVPDSVTFAILLNAVNGPASRERIGLLWEEYLSSSVTRSARTVASLIRALVRCGAVKEALEMVENRIDGVQDQWRILETQLTAEGLNHLTADLTQQNGLEGALQALALFAKGKISMDEQTVDSLVSGYASSARLHVSAQKQIEHSLSYRLPLRKDDTPHLATPAAGVQGSQIHDWIRPTLQSPNIPHLERISVPAEAPRPVSLLHELDARGIKLRGAHMARMIQVYVDQKIPLLASETFFFAIERDRDCLRDVFLPLANFYGYAFEHERLWTLLCDLERLGHKIPLDVMVDIAAQMEAQEYFQMAAGFLEPALPFALDRNDFALEAVIFRLRMRGGQYRKAIDGLRRRRQLLTPGMKMDIERFIAYVAKSGETVLRPRSKDAMVSNEMIDILERLLDENEKPQKGDMERYRLKVGSALREVWPAKKVEEERGKYIEGENTPGQD